MRLLSACLITVLLLIFTPTRIAAHTDYNFQEVSEGHVDDALLRLVPSRFLSSNPLYFLITAKENVARFFKPSASRKAEFDAILAGKKLKESYLLLRNGNVKNSAKTLARYSNRMRKMVDQLERARSQKQEVLPLVDFIAENLRVHETVFFGIEKEWEKHADAYDFDLRFAEVISAHAMAVGAIDNIKPGLGDRFTTAFDEATRDVQPTPSPLPTQEATPSVKPKRIIL